MKKIGVYVNQNKDKSFAVTEKLTKTASKLGFECNVFVEKQFGVDKQKRAQFIKNSDCVIVLGGDGTILRIAASSAKANVPVLSVNLGHLGFLTQLEENQISHGLEMLKKGEYTIENRMMLSCTVGKKEYLALNDVCIQRANRVKLVKFKVFAGEEYVDALSADGVLVSSPTGSTAYSLSCGGPIVSPRVSIMLVTPICAHTLRARPIVFKDDEVLRFESLDKCGFAVFCDGSHLKQANGATSVQVSKSKYSLKLVNFNQMSFFERLNSKFNEWNVLQGESK